MDNNKNFLKGLLSGLGIAVVGVGVFLAIYYGVPQFSNRIMSSAESAAETATSNNMAETDSVNITSPEVQDKLVEIQNAIDKYYLDEANESKLIDGIYAGLVSGLEDPYSVYYTMDELASMQEATSGEYSGIGATMSQNNETGVVTIVKPFEGSPAAQAGILPGDILYKVEGEEVTGVDLTSIVARVKGTQGTTVNLTIVREGESGELNFDVERRKIEVPTVTYEMLADNIGYIYVMEFDEITASQFKTALKDLEAQGMERLIIDLRDNPGGLLSVVCDMLDQLLPEGLIVYTEDKYGNRDEYKSDEYHQFTKPLVVLTNGNSASASEVFAGAIKDYGIGTLVGTTTFGKGIVQRIVNLSDGTAMKLTISKYYTPNGNNIHGIGIDPDVEVKLADELKQQVTITHEEDNQLQKAIEVIKEK